MTAITVKQNANAKDNAKKATSDSFVIQNGVTKATITSAKGTDTLDLTKMTGVSNVSATQKKGTKDLLVYVYNTDSSKNATITIKNYFTSKSGNATKSTLKNIKYKAGTDSVSTKLLAIDEGINTYYNTYKPNKKNVVTGTDFNDEINMSKQNKKLTIKSGYGNDVIYASKKGSTIYSQHGHNSIFLSSAADTVYAGDKSDYIIETKNHGNDVIYAGKNSSTTISFDNTAEKGVLSGDLSYAIKGNDVIITNKNSNGKNETITVKDYLKNSTNNVSIATASSSGGMYSYKSLKEILDNIVGTSRSIDKSKAKKGQTINGTLLKENITGSKYADTIYSNGEWDTITAGRGNDKIYLNRDESSNKVKSKADLYFSKGDGNDTIYGGNSSNWLYLTDLNYSDRNKLSFSKSGKDLIIKRSDSTKDSLTLSNYFRTNTYDDNAINRLYCNDDYICIDDQTIKVSGKGTVKGSFLDDYITGSTKNDKMYGYEGDDIFYGGKGNDVIYTSNSDSYVLVGKGDGNDTISINKNYDDTYIVFNKDPDLSYTRKGNDLIITATHAKEGKEKTAVKENVTIKSYFRADGMPGAVNYDDVYIGVTSQTNMSKLNTTDALSWSNVPYKDLQELLVSSTVVQKGDAKKQNFLIGTYGNDVMYGGNKDDVMEAIVGNNTFYTGQKGGSILIGGSRDDKYVVSSIGNSTFIAEQSLGYGYSSGMVGDTLQINGTNANDLYMYFDVSSETGLMARNSSYSSSKSVMPVTAALYLMNGSEFTSNLKSNAFATAPTMEAINKKKSMSYDNTKITKTGPAGVTINDYFGDGSLYSGSGGYFDSSKYFGSHGYFSSYGYFSSGGYGGSGSYYLGTIGYGGSGGYGSMEHITLADSKGNNAKELNNYNVRAAVLNIFGRVQEFLSLTGKTDTNQVLSEIKKTLNKKETKNMTKAQKTALANEKKAANTLLTQLTNIYKSSRVGTDGNDTFTNVKANKVSVNNTTIVDYQTIYSGRGSDTFKMAKNFGNVEIYSQYNMGMREQDKLVFSDYAFEDGTLGINMYNGINNFEINAYNGSKRVGELYYGASPYSGVMSGLMYMGSGGYNPYQYKEVAIQDSKRTYNLNYASGMMDLSSTTGNNIMYAYDDAMIATSKGYNIINSEYYAGSSGYHEEISLYNTGGHDKYVMYGDIDNDYYINNFDKNTSVSIFDGGGDDELSIIGYHNNMKVYFGVSASDSFTSGDLLIMDKDNFNQNNIVNANKNTKGVLIHDYFGEMEYLDIRDKASGAYIDEEDMYDMVNDIKSQVVSWLNSKGYGSTEAVFESNKTNDINALIAIYKNVDATDYSSGGGFYAK